MSTTETRETGQEMTDATADRYVDSLRALDVLHDGLTELGDRGIDIRTADARQIAAACRMAAASWPLDQRDQLARDAVDEWGDLDADAVSERGVAGAWLDGCLAIELKGSRALSDKEWTIDGVEVLLGFGGPSVRLTGDGSRLVLRVDWWGDSATRYPYAPTIAAELDEIATSWEGS